MGRLGVEIHATPKVMPWLLIELGPAIGAGNFGVEVDFAARATVGVAFW